VSLPCRLTCSPFLAGLLAAVCLSQLARADDVTITIAGTVFSGTDETGVFGFPKNTDLTGKPFTLTFAFDDTKGTEAFTSTGSYIKNTSASNPGTAALQIGDGSFGFGTLGYSPYQSEARVSSAGSVTNSEYALQAGDGNYGGNWNDIQGTISPARGTVLTTNPSWEAPFSNSNLAVYSPSDNYSLSFGIIETFQDNPALNMIANGYLTVAKITVSGPTTCSSANVSLFLPAPQYMQAKFVAPTTLTDYKAACGFVSLNWQQQITTDPGTPVMGTDKIIPNTPLNVPNNVYPTADCATTYSAVQWPMTNCTLVAGPATTTSLASDYPPYYDPPAGGYTYLGASYDPFPFVYPLSYVSSSGFCTVPLGGAVCDPEPPGIPYIVSSDGTTLSFVDNPATPSLPGKIASTNPKPGTFLAFSTSLFGVDYTNKAHLLYSWTWNSTWNGKACNGILTLLGLCSGVSIIQTASIYPIIPGTGTGGVTITSINGVQLPSVVPPTQVATTASGLAYSRVSQTFNGTVTLTNISSSAISGPLQILFTGMPGNVTLVNATANLSGTPYLTVPAVGSLAPSQSVTVTVQFRNPSDTTINLSPVIYSGSIN
jgi:hypothetical protein